MSLATEWFKLHYVQLHSNEPGKTDWFGLGQQHFTGRCLMLGRILFYLLLGVVNIMEY